MIAILVALAAFEITSGSANDTAVPSAKNHASREWTNASGTKRVQAVLVGAEGDKLWLRRPDGKLATTTVAQLSDVDRQYVATNPIHLATTSTPISKPPGLTSKIVQKIGDQVQSIAKLPRWTQPSQPEVQERLIPAAIVYIRVSRAFLDDYVERNVSRTKSVSDYILGTRVTGESETRGKTRLELLPGSGRLSGKISFEGTVHARTRGYNGPVVLHQISNSTFHSSKTIALDKSGLKVAPSVTSAPTQLETTGISSSLPRLRGRIATRIAWRRVSSSHQKAECITAEHTAATISRDFDQSTNESLAKLQGIFKSKIPELNVDQGSKIAEVRFRTNQDSVEMAMVRVAAGTEERKLRPPLVEGNPDVAVRLHRTLLVRAITDPQMREDLAPLVAKLLKKRVDSKELESVKSEGKRLADSTKWSIDPDWLTMDFKDSSR